MTPLLSVEDTARLLGLSPWTVRAYVREGKLKPVRLGRRLLFEQTDIEDLVAHSKQATDDLLVEAIKQQTA